MVIASSGVVFIEDAMLCEQLQIFRCRLPVDRKIIHDKLDPDERDPDQGIASRNDVIVDEGHECRHHN